MHARRRRAARNTPPCRPRRLTRYVEPPQLVGGANSKWISGDLLQQTGLNCSTAIARQLLTPRSWCPESRHTAGSTRCRRSATRYWTAFLVSIPGSATSVKVGDLVNLNAQSSDATSGTTGQYTWVFGDNTSNGAGASTSHTYPQAGTCQVKSTASDGAGHPGEAKQVITVNPPQSGGGTGGDGGTITKPPTNNNISNEAGGGGDPDDRRSLGLQVVAP